MPGLLNELGRFASVIPLAGIGSGTQYNGAAAGATGIDTMLYDQIYLRISAAAATTSGGVVASVIASESNSPVASDVETVATFGTLVAGAVQTGFVLCKGKKRYFWIKTVSTNAEAGVLAQAMLFNYDRPPTPAVASDDTFNVNY